MANQQVTRGITIKPGDVNVEKKSSFYQLARAYVPWQRYTTKWDPMEGLAKGTIFPELYRPYKSHKRNI